MNSTEAPTPTEADACDVCGDRPATAWLGPDVRACDECSGRPPAAYMREVREAAMSRNRFMYVWRTPSGDWLSSIHFAVVGFTYWTVTPSGRVLVTNP